MLNTGLRVLGVPPGVHTLLYMPVHGPAALSSVSLVVPLVGTFLLLFGEEAALLVCLLPHLGVSRTFAKCLLSSCSSLEGWHNEAMTPLSCSRTDITRR